MSFTNSNKSAPWKSRLYSVDEWRSSLRRVHWLFQIPYVTVHNVEADELHVIHIGVSQYLAGSVLWLLLFKILRGNVEGNLELVWKTIVQFYQDNKTRCKLSKLQLNMFMDPSKSERTMPYPRLMARGAETKHLIPALLFAWETLARKSRSEFYAHVKSCL